MSAAPSLANEVCLHRFSFPTLFVLFCSLLHEFLLLPDLHEAPDQINHSINLVVVLSIWAMPCPSSACFVVTKCVRQHKVVKGGKLQKSESSLICVIIAEGSTNALPVSSSIPAHFCIPVALYNKNVLLRCLINDIL